MVVCCTCIVYFGLRFGKNKSLLWMMVFLFGALEHMLLLDPVKIVLISFILAIVFKVIRLEYYTTLTDKFLQRISG